MNKNAIIGVLAVVVVGLVAFLVINSGGDSGADNQTAQATMNESHDGHDHSQDNPLEVTSQEEDNTPKTTVQFFETEHDFGTISQDQKVRHTFKFKNTGENPLIITNARGSCGCTVPQWPREAIAPGEEADIEVEFSSGKKSGMQNKTVTITANTEPKDNILKISANVEKAAQANTES